MEGAAAAAVPIRPGSTPTPLPPLGSLSFQLLTHGVDDASAAVLLAAAKAVLWNATSAGGLAVAGPVDAALDMSVWSTRRQQRVFVQNVDASTHARGFARFLCKEHGARTRFMISEARRAEPTPPPPPHCLLNLNLQTPVHPTT